MEEHEERTEWRVESESTEDEFGTYEQDARDWVEHCRNNPDWEPVRLLSRVVTTHKTEWTEAD